MTIEIKTVKDEGIININGMKKVTKGVWIAKNTIRIIEPKTGAITSRIKKYVIVVAKNKLTRKKK